MKFIALLSGLSVIFGGFFAQPHVASAQTPCEATFRAEVRNSAGQVLSNINWALHVQDYDADNNPVLGQQVAAGRTDIKGIISGKFNPDRFMNNVNEKRYAYKIYEINPNAGYFVYYNKLASCGSAISDSFTLSRLRFVLRNVSGESLKQFRWQLFTQKRDVDGVPIPDVAVSTNLTTEDTGVKYIHLSPGTYYARVYGEGNLEYQISDIVISAGRQTDVEEVLSSLRLVARTLSGERASDISIEVWTQRFDLANEPVGNTRVSTKRIGTTGFEDVFLPPGLYALKSGEQWIYNVRISENYVTEAWFTKDGNLGIPDRVTEPRSTPTRPNNTLVKTESNPRVYVLINGLRHYLPSLVIFNAYGFSWENLVTISDEEMSSYQEGPALTLPEHLEVDEGSVVKGSSPAVYLIENGTKRAFVTAEAFIGNGHNWDDIIAVSDTVLSGFPEGEPISTYAIGEGSLVKIPDQPAVYLIEEGKRRPFLNGRIYIILGYEWDQIRTVTPAEINGFTIGEGIDFAPDDVDRDGLSLDDENAYGTDPFNDDSDGDGFFDGEEVNNGYNPAGPGLL